MSPPVFDHSPVGPPGSADGLAGDAESTVPADRRPRETKRVIEARLTKSQRRKVRQAVQGGDRVWDEASAKYALVAAHEIERPLVFGRFAHYVLHAAIAVLFIAVTVEAIGDDDGLGIALFGAIAVAATGFAVVGPFIVRNARRVREINAGLLPDGFVVDRPQATRGKQLTGPMVGGVAAGICFGGLGMLFDGQHLEEGAAKGAAFGAVMGLFSWFGNRREHRQASRD